MWSTIVLAPFAYSKYVITCALLKGILTLDIKLTKQQYASAPLICAPKDYRHFPTAVCTAHNHTHPGSLIKDRNNKPLLPKSRLRNSSRPVSRVHVRVPTSATGLYKKRKRYVRSVPVSSLLVTTPSRYVKIMSWCDAVVHLPILPIHTA